MDEELRILCQLCRASARWSVCNLEGDNMDPITRGHACGRHLNRVLEEMHWDLDHVRVYDLSAPVDAA